MRTRMAGLWILGLLLVLGVTAVSARQADHGADL
jgi:hypothetical protein